MPKAHQQEIDLLALVQVVHSVEHPQSISHVHIVPVREVLLGQSRFAWIIQKCNLSVKTVSAKFLQYVGHVQGILLGQIKFAWIN